MSWLQRCHHCWMHLLFCWCRTGCAFGCAFALIPGPPQLPPVAQLPGSCTSSLYLQSGGCWHAAKPCFFFWVVVSNIFYFHPYLGKIPILTNIFQRGWNHQPVLFFSFFFPGYFFWMDQGPDLVCSSDGTHLVRNMFGFKKIQLLWPIKWKKVLGDPLVTNWIHVPSVWDMKRHKSHHTLRIQLDLYFKILCLRRYTWFHSEKGLVNYRLL